MEKLKLELSKEEALDLHIHLTQTEDDSPNESVAETVKETNQKLKVFLLKEK